MTSHRSILTDLSKKVEPILEKLEQSRVSFLIEYRWRRSKALIFGTVAFIIVTIIALLSTTVMHWVEEVWGVALVIAFMAWRWVDGPVKEYNKAYKNDIIPHILKVIGNFNYSVGGKSQVELKVFGHSLMSAGRDIGILSSKKFLIEESGIIPNGNWGVEDTITGNHKGVDTTFSELIIERGSGKNSKIVFRGAIILLSFPKLFESDIHIGQDYGFANKLTSMGKKGKKRVNLVDPKFEDRYETYGSDQTMARYIVNPSFMEEFMALDDLFRKHAKGKGIEASFYDNNVLVKLGYSKNLLEAPNIHKHAVSMEEIELLYSEINIILGIIDALSLEKFATK